MDVALKGLDYSKAGLRVPFGICSFSTCEALGLVPRPFFSATYGERNQLEEDKDHPKKCLSRQT